MPWGCKLRGAEIDIQAVHYWWEVHCYLYSGSLTSLISVCVEKCPVCTRCYDSSARGHDNRYHGDSVASWCCAVFSTVFLRHIRLSRVAALPPAAEKVWCLVYTDLLTILVTEIRENLDILQCHFVINYTDPFNGLFSGTTRVSRYQKGKANLDFTEARDSEWQWHQLGRMQVCTSLQIDNHTSTPPLSFFTNRMSFLLLNQQHQSTEGIVINYYYVKLLHWKQYKDSLNYTNELNSTVFS